MTRKLAAALACRAGGSRLYGKPLQTLDLGRGTTILAHIVECIRAGDEIDEIVLGISEGVENLPFLDVARQLDTRYIVGDERDVLWRLVQCGRAAAATDVFRVTTECPFTAWELLPEAWRRHVANENDITVVDFLPEGAHFELYTLEALERSHRDGTEDERSEFCSLHARRNVDSFRIEVVEPSPEIRRLDLRLTVDYPEDLVLCRRVHDELSSLGPRIPLREIVAWLDARPELASLVADFVDPTPAWAEVQRAS